MREMLSYDRTTLAEIAGIPVEMLTGLEEQTLPIDPDVKEKLQAALGCTLYFGSHCTVPIRDPWSGEVEDIDEGIAPLIRELWAARIPTNMSCQQDGSGYVWIAF